VILPKANQKDLRDLPDEVRSEMKFTFAEHIEDVLSTAIPPLGERIALIKNRPIDHAA
jgi:ATP-dependent Lon protease